MRLTIKQLSSRIRSPRTARRAPGYAFVVMMIAVTVMLIALTASLPSVYQEGQREREEELIFRGNEYARAIYLFQRQFHRYPASVKELLHTNNLSFLRHAYRDPMTPDGQWRFIHITANGAVLDSLTLAPQGTSPLGGNAQGTSPLGGNSQGTSPLGGNSQGTSPLGGNTSSVGGTSILQPTSGLGQGGTSSTSNQNETPEQKKKRLGCAQHKKGELTSSFFDEKAGTLSGAFIVGVASCSDHESIRIWNKHTRYDEWEFIGNQYIPYGQSGQQTPPNPLGNQGGQQGQQGQQSTTSPTGSSILPGQPLPPDTEAPTAPEPPEEQTPPDQPDQPPH
jgi:type II secretory pathway pseudopilin PulG